MLFILAETEWTSLVLKTVEDMGARIIMLMTVIIPTMYVATDVGLFVGSAGYAMFLLQQTEMSIAVGMSVKEKTNRGKYP